MVILKIRMDGDAMTVVSSHFHGRFFVTLSKANETKHQSETKHRSEEFIY